MNKKKITQNFKRFLSKALDRLDGLRRKKTEKEEAAATAATDLPEISPAEPTTGETAPLPAATQAEPPQKTGETAPLPVEMLAKEESGRRRTGCLSILTFSALVLGLSVLLAGVMIVSANDMFALLKDDRAATFLVKSDDTLEDVAGGLREAGLIRYPFLFRLFASVSNMEENIAPGEYELNAAMDYRTMLSRMRKRPEGRQVVTLTFREGMTQREIFEMLEENGVCEAWRLAGAAKYFDYSYSFVKNLPYTDRRLEGYLFPDTYNFYIDENPIAVVRKFLANFNQKLTVDMKARAENIGFTIEEIVIIASMIEREARFDDERPMVSSVIYNRLKNANFPYLQIDATVQYALPEYKEALSDEDLTIDSPYNTYKVRGLPIGPISNPGLAALRAALYPDETDYYYYVARKNGYHYFSKTLAEHQQAIRRALDEIIEDETSDDTPAIIDG